MTSDKSKIRKQFLQSRRQMGIEVVKEYSRKICSSFNNNFDSKKLTALYHPVNNEVNPLLISADITLLPCIISENEPLVFKKWSEGDALKFNIYNIPQPLDDLEIMLPEILVVPMVAFDEVGARVGYGGGYYDRTISYLKAVQHKFIAVGLAFESQKTPKINTDKYDQRLDYIITENQIYNFKK